MMSSCVKKIGMGITLFCRFFVPLHPVKIYSGMADNLKQISCKIDPETLALIDAHCHKRGYVKRNGMINAILSTVMRCASETTLERMMVFSDKFYTRAPIEFYPNKK